MKKQHSSESNQFSYRTIPTFQNSNNDKLQQQLFKITNQFLKQKRGLTQLHTKFESHSNQTNRKINQLFQYIKDQKRNFEETSDKQRHQFLHEREKARDQIAQLRMKNINLEAKISNLTDRIYELQWRKH